MTTQPHDSGSQASGPQEQAPKLTDADLQDLFDGCDFSTMVTADDLFYLIARAVEDKVRATTSTRKGAEVQAVASQANVSCIGGNPSCPCQDGDACHYEDAADGTKAWAVASHAEEVPLEKWPYAEGSFMTPDKVWTNFLHENRRRKALEAEVAACAERIHNQREEINRLAALAATQPASKCDSLTHHPLHTDEAGEAKRLADDAKRLVRLCHGREDPFGAIDAAIDRLAALASQTKGGEAVASRAKGAQE